MTTTLDVAKLRDDFKEPHELLNASDGKTIFLRRWMGQSEAGPAILILHGITAYSEPYGKLMAAELAESGFNVFGMDLRGHGRSDGRRGDYPSRERLVKDLCETLSLLRGRYSRVIVLGHSLGVLSAIVAVNSCPENVDGIILLSAGKRIKPGAYAKPPIGVALKTLLGVTLLPGSRLIEYRRRGMGGQDDPLFNFRYTARFYSILYGVSTWSVVRMLRRNTIDSPNMVISAGLDLPVFFGVGDQDELFDVDSAKTLFDSLKSSKKEFFVVPGGHHGTFPKGSWGPVIGWLGRNNGTH
jgi:alpha-beta hydrolase superfamily lysophospholipase